MPPLQDPFAGADLQNVAIRVALPEAETVFFHDLARIHADPNHSEDEGREIIVGHSTVDRLLLVVFVEYSDHVRIISARKTTSFERADYEEKRS